MAIFTPTITPGGSIGPITGPFTGPITGPITGTVNPNLGNLWKDDFTIDTYQNKYLDATGVQRLWKRTLEEIHTSINSASAKIIPLDFSNGSLTITRSDSMSEEDEAILLILMGLGSQDIMTWENNKTYYYSKSVNNTAYWYNSNSSQVDVISCAITYNSNSTSITQAIFSKSVNKYSAISLVSSDGKNTLTYDNLSPFKTQGVTTPDESTALAKDYIIIGNGNRTIKSSGYQVLSSGSITAGDGIHLPTAGSVANYVTNAIKDATNDLVAIAEGKTKAYTISATSYTENSGFNSTDATITLSINQSIKTAEGISVNIADLKRGDIIFLTDNNLPDRWVSVISNDTVGFNAVEGKVDLSSYQTKLAKTGDLDKPIYVSAAGTISECSKYAGGTSITLNGTDEAGKAVTFYAPTSLGVAGTILKVNSDRTGFTFDTDCIPTAHAVVDKTYGGATDNLYGHVKLVRGDVDDYNSKNETVGKALAADAYHTHSNYIRKTVSSGTYSKTISDVQDSFTVTIKNNNANQTVFKQTDNYFNLWVKGQDSNPSQDWKFLSGGKIIRTANSQTYLVIDTSMVLTTTEIDTILANTTTD